MGRALLSGVVWLLLVSAGRADPAPAPDPRKGERSDGKIREARRYDDLLVVPRILLAPPRLLVRAIAEPVRLVLALDARYGVLRFLARFITSEDGLRGIRPSIRYISRFAPQMGVTYFDRKLMGPGSTFSLTVGAVLPALIFAEAHVQPRLPDPYRLYLDAGYLSRDDVLFAGVGRASDGDLEARAATLSRYAQRQVDAAVALDWKIHRHVHLRVAEGFALRRYDDGRGAPDAPPISVAYCVPSIRQACLFPAVDATRVPGFYEGATYLSTDALLSFDTRSGTHEPRMWFRLELSGRYAQGLGRGWDRWVRARGVVAAGFPLGSRARSLVLRVAVDLLEPLGDTVVPFSELVTLGGPDDFRGAQIGRFRDHASVLATVEYRWAVWMWMDAVLFTDWGGTFGPHLRDFRFDRLLPDVGAGLRVHTDHHFVMRAQVAYGFTEGWQVLFATSTGL